MPSETFVISPLQSTLLLFRLQQYFSALIPCSFFQWCGFHLCGALISAETCSVRGVFLKGGHFAFESSILFSLCIALRKVARCTQVELSVGSWPTKSSIVSEDA